MRIEVKEKHNYLCMHCIPKVAFHSGYICMCKVFTLRKMWHAEYQLVLWAASVGTHISGGQFNWQKLLQAEMDHHSPLSIEPPYMGTFNCHPHFRCLKLGKCVLPLTDIIKLIHLFSAFSKVLDLEVDRASWGSSWLFGAVLHVSGVKPSL